jgi:hypothetical protein
MNASKYIRATTVFHIFYLIVKIYLSKKELMPIGSKEQLHYHENATQFFYVLKVKPLFIWKMMFFY